MPPPLGIKDLNRVSKKYWLDFAHHGTYDTQEYRFRSQSEVGLAGYATKFLTEPENIIFSVEFPRKQYFRPVASRLSSGPRDQREDGCTPHLFQG